MSDDSSTTQWAAFVAPPAILLVTVLVSYPLYRALWDPVYCCFISTADARLLRSWPLREIAPGVHLSQHLVTSGRGSVCSRHLTKHSRMLVVNVGDDELCLINPCPLTEDVRRDIAGLGRVGTVLITNCFHYMYGAAYAAAYPTARFLAPRRLLHKKPALKSAFVAYPTATTGVLAAGVSYFRLPDFYEETVIHVSSAHLLYVSDTLVAWDTALPNPGRTICCGLMACTRWASLKNVRAAQHARLYYATYARQYRVGDGHSLKENVNMWRRILDQRIERVVTGHGVFDGSMAVSGGDIRDLLHTISAADTCVDRAGREVFVLCVLRCCARRFRDWASLYDDELVHGSAGV